MTYVFSESHGLAKAYVICKAQKSLHFDKKLNFGNQVNLKDDKAVEFPIHIAIQF